MSSSGLRPGETRRVVRGVGLPRPQNLLLDPKPVVNFMGRLGASLFAKADSILLVLRKVLVGLVAVLGLLRGAEATVFKR